MKLTIAPTFPVSGYLKLGMLLTALSLASALSAADCTCSCHDYARMIDQQTPLTPDQSQKLDQCGAACAIAWASCDKLIEAGELVFLMGEVVQEHNPEEQSSSDDSRPDITPPDSSSVRY
jgi:hypothetical protein